MKLFLNSTGCRLNQAEIEKVANQLVQAGNVLVDSEEHADVVILNTCAVTLQAASDSRGMIRHAVKKKPKQIIVTGCLATLEPNSIKNIDRTSWVVSNSEKDHLVDQFTSAYGEEMMRGNQLRTRVPGPRYRTRAFIKAQDGCDHYCTYCITRLARGKARSILQIDILKDVQNAETSGIKEVILTGVQLGSWGKDLQPMQRLSDLVKGIVNLTQKVRIRLSSVEPWDLNEDFYLLWSNPRICRQLHLPLQSGSNRILRLMGRKNTAGSYEQIIHKIRDLNSEIAITTDILVGFPGETEADFQESIRFINRMNFSGGHVFSFSPRNGTLAEKMDGQVPHQIKKERNSHVKRILLDAQILYRERFLNKTLDVLWESSRLMKHGIWEVKGLSDNYIPVIAMSKDDLYDQISKVRIDEILSEQVKATILHK